MNKFIYSLAFSAVTCLGMHAQEFQGMAIYESKTSMADFKANRPNNRDITPEMEKMMEERMKTMFEKTFVLNFDKSASIYKEQEKLETPGGQQGGIRMMSSMMGGGGTYYKNVKDKSYTVDKEFMGKEFLVKDSLNNLKWKMEGETRVIGGYNCFKATAVLPASTSDFRNFRPKKEEDEGPKPEGEKPEGNNADNKEKKTDFLSGLSMPKEVVVTAWYTPEIPVNQGPDKYWGLPGLILEINDGKTVVLCSKVVLNPKTKADIKAPSNGKTISQKDYDEVVVKKMKEMQEMNQGRNGNGGMRMRMGN